MTLITNCGHFTVAIQTCSAAAACRQPTIVKLISACTDTVRPCHSDASSQPLMPIKVDQCMQSAFVIVVPPVNHLSAHARPLL